MKKSFALVTAFIISLISAFALLSGCAFDAEYGYRSKTYYGVMNSLAELTVYDTFTVNGVADNEKADKFIMVADETETLLRGLDSSLSTAYENSDISRFNAAEGGTEVEIGEDAYNVLSVAMEIYRLTDGYYNPAVYYSVRAYGFNGGTEPKDFSELPSDDVLSGYTQLSSKFSELVLSNRDGKYYALKPESVTVGGEVLPMRLDLGGVGKGYAADKVEQLLEDNGYKYFKFNFASSSVSFGRFPSEEETFRLGLSNPRKEEEGAPITYMSLDVCDASVSSSADDVNFYTLTDANGEERRFCHIFNPFTGRPIDSGIMSATVIGGKAAENDALTTAIMAMGVDKAISFIDEKLTEGPFERRVAFSFADDSGYKFYTNIPEGEYIADSENFTPIKNSALR